LFFCVANYLEGAELCKTNSDRLQTTARIILRDSDGTDSFALFLYYIAYEEIAKAVFCLFVHKGYVSEEFISQVFERHHPKIALFEEIFRSFVYKDGTVHLDGRPLGEISLRDIIRIHLEKIHEHRRTTMEFLYVDKNAEWKVPQVEIPDIESKEREIQSKIYALNLIFEVVNTVLENVDTQADNFQFYENSDGNFTLQYDQI